MFRGAKGGSSSFKQTPDNLRSNDTFEGVLGLCVGPIKGPVRGLKSIKMDDTAIENATGEQNFQDFTATIGDGDPLKFPQRVQLKLGAGAAPTQVGLALRNVGGGNPIFVTKTLPNTNADFIDMRFIAQQLFRQDAKGIYGTTATIEIRMKPTGSTTWINPTLGAATSNYQETGLSLNNLRVYLPEANYDEYGAPYQGQQNYVISGKTNSPAVYELRIAVPNTGPYANTGWDVQARLLERESYTGGKDNTDQEARTIQWESMAAVYGNTMGDHEDWRGLAWLQLYGKASDALTGVPEVRGEYDTKLVQIPANFNPDTRQYAPGIWDGSWATAYTNDPAWVLNNAISDELSGISLIAPGSFLNKWDALDLSKHCSELVPDGNGGTEPRYSLNLAVSTPQKAEEFVRYLAGAVGALAWDQGDGEWRCKVDKADAPSDIFTLDNVEGEFIYAHTDVDTRYNDIIGKFKNAEMDYVEDGVQLFDNPSIALIGRKPTTIALVGCTTRQEALRRVKLRLRSTVNENRIVTFTTNRRGRNIEQLSTILIADGDLGTSGGTIEATSEKVKNPSFDTTSDWTFDAGSASISGGQLNVSGGTRFVSQPNVTVPGQTYTATIDVKSVASGGNLRFGNGDTNADRTITVWPAVAGVKTFTFVATGTTIALEADSAVFYGSIASISVTKTEQLSSDKRTTGRTVAVSGDRKSIVVRDPIYMAPGVDYKMWFTIPNPDYSPDRTTQPTSTDWTKPTIAISRDVVVGAGGVTTTINLATALPESIADNLSVALEAPGMPTMPRLYRVTAVQPSDDGERISISAINIDTGKWVASDNVTRQDTVFTDLRGIAGPATLVPGHDLLSVVRVPLQQGDQINLQANWVRPAGAFISGFRVQYSVNGSALQTSVERQQVATWELPNAGPGKYHVEICTIDRRGGYSAPLVGDLEVTQSLIDATQVAYTGGETLEQLKPAQGGADVTGQNTAADTAAVAGRPAAAVLVDVNKALQDVAQASADIVTLREAIENGGGGDLSEQVNAANAARDAAIQAKQDAEAALALANAAATNAGNYQAGSQAARDAAAEANRLAGLAQAAAQSAKSAAETAQGLANDAANLAAQRASDANGYAETASGHASFASQKATDAGQFATNASASADSASTKAGEASGYASQALTSKNDAAGAASAAARDSGLAATAKTDAQDAATASYNSSQSAAASSDNANGRAYDASQSASAANQSKLDAQTAKGQAEVARSEAVTSASNASGSEQRAAASEGVATQAKNDAAGSAWSASQDAQTATSKATEAGTSASAANTARTAAETAKGQAETYRNEASTSASNASGSESAASTSAGVAANSASRATREAAKGLTADFNNRDMFVEPTAAGGIFADRPKKDYQWFMHTENEPGEGAVLITEYYTSGPYTLRGAIKLEPLNRYRIQGRAGYYRAPSNSPYPPYVYFGWCLFDSAGNYVDTLYTYAATPPLGRWVDHDTNMTTEEIKARNSAAAYISPMFIANHRDENPTRDSKVGIGRLSSYNMTAEANASASAQAAAGSASNASTSESNAGQSASAANGSKVAAQTAQGKAEVAQGQAAISESNASGSASSAATQAGLAVSAKNAAATTVANTIPGDFNSNQDYWSRFFDGPIDRGDAFDYHYQFNPYGDKTLVITSDQQGASYDVAHRGLIKLVPGRFSRLTVQWRVRYAANARVLGVLYAIGAKASGQAWYTPGLDIEINSGTAGWGTDSGYARRTYDFDHNSLIASGSTHLRGLMRFQSQAPGQVWEMLALNLEDITSEYNASQSAYASNQSAGTASAKADEASSSASAANLSKIDAQTAKGNAELARSDAVTAKNDANTASYNAATSATLSAKYAGDAASAGQASNSNPGASTSTWASDVYNTFKIVRGDGTSLNERMVNEPGLYSVGSNGKLRVTYGHHIHPIAPVAVDPTRRQRLTFQGRIVGEYGPGGDITTYLACFDKDGNLLFGNVLQMGHRPAGITNPATGTFQVTAEFRPSDYGAGIAYIRPMVRTPGNQQTEIDFLLLTDMENVKQAETFASNASASAAAADGFRSSAQTYSEISASVSGGALNRNSNFANFPADGNVPYWESWNSAGTTGYLRKNGTVDLSLSTPTVEGSPYAMHLASANGQDAGLSQLFGIGGGFVNLQGTVQLTDGSWDGSGFIIQCFNASGGYLGEERVDFLTTPDVNGLTAAQLATAFKVRKFNRTVAVPGGQNAVSCRVYLMNSWSGFGHGSAYKSMVWYKCAVTTATDADGKFADVAARVTTVEGVAATAAGRTEAYFTKELTAGGAAAFISARAKDDNGTYTSNVSFGATSIQLYNQTTGGFKLAMQLSGGNAVFTGSLNVGATIRLGSGAGWPVALAQRDFNVADGANMAFGVDLTNVPDFAFLRNNLAPLNSGETYQLYIENPTSTGGTLRAKISTPGTNTSVTLTSQNKPGSGPTAQIEKGGNADAQDGYYNISVATNGTGTSSYSGNQ